MFISHLFPVIICNYHKIKKFFVYFFPGFFFFFFFLSKSSKELISNLLGHSSGGKHYAPLLKLFKFCFNTLSMCVFWRAILKLKADGEKNSLSETKL